MIRIILSIVVILMYYKYGSITTDNILLYNTLASIYEGLLILVIYFITKNKLHSVLIFAIVEMILYCIQVDMILYQIILLRMIALIFWLGLYKLWDIYGYKGYLMGMIIHIIYNVSADVGNLFIIILILVWLSTLYFEDSPRQTLN